jgi:hypothetical protein
VIDPSVGSSLGVVVKQKAFVAHNARVVVVAGDHAPSSSPHVALRPSESVGVGDIPLQCERR